MATKKDRRKAEEIKIDEVKTESKKAVSGGPFAPRRDGDPFIPCNREEQFLFMIATGDGDDYVEPVKREEAFLASIAFGTPDDCPDPCTRHELLLTGIAYRMGELIAGGNPNSVQVINGTVANPWGDVDFQELFDSLPYPNVGIALGNATALLEIDATALGAGAAYGYVTRKGSLSLGSNGAVVSASQATFFGTFWNESGELVFLCMGTVDSQGNGNITNVMEYASLLPTTLTIMWHPMPTP